MSNGDQWTTGTVTFPYPWDTTGGHPVPDQPEWKQPYTTPNVTWPPPLPQHPAELENFEEFVIWACGFTDPEHPPSQQKWEEFQEKVRQLAADFVEYKRVRREAERMQPYQPQTWTTTATASNL